MRFIFLATALVLASVASADSKHDFDILLEDHWEWRLEQSPIFASRLGDRRYNQNWTDNRIEAIEARQEARKNFVERVDAIKREALNADDQLNYDLFRRALVSQIEEHEFKGYLLPLSHRGGIQTLDSMTNFLSFRTLADYEDWLVRLSRIDEVVTQTIALAEAGRESGYMPPKVLMERIPDQLATQLVEEPEQSPFFRLFKELPDTVSSDDQDRLREEAKTVISETVLPAYRRFAAYFNETYLPASRDSIALADLPDGPEWYAFLARDYTTTDMTPDQIHTLGLSEVQRIRNAMQAIIEEVEFEGTFAEFLTFLRTDPQFYYDDPDQLYQAYLATSKRIDPELVRLFGKLPRMPYGVKPIPEATAPDTTTAYYSRPAGDGSRAGIYWVNLYKPEVRPKYEIEVLTVHEAMPGHHLQLALQQELGEMPKFRRFSGFTAFSEGWGLYSEALGYDLGLYKDPYSRFGQLTYEMWRAVRLVVDTGMHVKGWSRDKAIAFFKENAAKTEHDIVNEIDRYIGNPGQALAYKVGQLKMLELRQRAESALGEKFDIRAFHDHLIGAGALPLDVLEQRMDAWIAEQS